MQARGPLEILGEPHELILLARITGWRDPNSWRIAATAIAGFLRDTTPSVLVTEAGFHRIVRRVAQSVFNEVGVTNFCDALPPDGIGLELDGFERQGRYTQDEVVETVLASTHLLNPHDRI